jgi:hypothetical protein
MPFDVDVERTKEGLLKYCEDMTTKTDTDEKEL